MNQAKRVQRARKRSRRIVRRLQLRADRASFELRVDPTKVLYFKLSFRDSRFIAKWQISDKALQGAVGLWADLNTTSFFVDERGRYHMRIENTLIFRES